MDTPKISVLINTYNYGHFVGQAIESVLAQDFPMDQVEIVVVDDGSTDDTAERISKYGARVRYFYKGNGGQGSAFNLGFSKSCGEFVFLLDADDYFVPGKLRRVMLEFEKDPDAGMVYHSLLEVDTRSGSTRETEIARVSGFLPDDKAKLLAYRIYPTSGMVFRRTVLERLLPMPEKIRIQADTWVSLLAPLVAGVLALPEALSVYRIHGQNLYYTDEAAITMERKLAQIDTFLSVIEKAGGWARKKRLELKDVSSRISRLYLGWWFLSFKEARFKLDPPGRLEFLVFFMMQNYIYSSEQTWRLTLFNYLSSPLALLLGYQRAESVYEWRDRGLLAVQTMLGRRQHERDSIE